MDILQKFKELKAAYDYNNQTPQINAPIEYSTPLIPKESIEQATKDFYTDNYKLLNALTTEAALKNPLANIGYGGDLDQAAEFYKQLGDDLDKKYGLTGERSLRDTIETRVAVLETKVDDLQDKIDQHEAKTERLFEKMSDTLDEIRDELKNFSLNALNLRNDIDGITKKGETIWHTVTTIGGWISVVIGVIYTISKDFIH